MDAQESRAPITPWTWALTSTVWVPLKLRLHRFGLNLEVMHKQRHNHAITSDGVDFVTGHVLKPCGCETPAEVTEGLSLAEWNMEG